MNESCGQRVANFNGFDAAQSLCEIAGVIASRTLCDLGHHDLQPALVATPFGEVYPVGIRHEWMMRCTVCARTLSELKVDLDIELKVDLNSAYGRYGRASDEQ